MPADHPQPPVAVLFDLDGTLIDTYRLYLECYRRALEPHLGYAPADAEIAARRPSSERRFLAEWLGEQAGEAQLLRSHERRLRRIEAIEHVDHRPGVRAIADPGGVVRGHGGGTGSSRQAGQAGSFAATFRRLPARRQGRRRHHHFRRRRSNPAAATIMARHAALTLSFFIRGSSSCPTFDDREAHRIRLRPADRQLRRALAALETKFAGFGRPVLEVVGLSHRHLHVRAPERRLPEGEALDDERDELLEQL